jgi:hypothetical protein
VAAFPATFTDVGVSTFTVRGGTTRLAVEFVASAECPFPLTRPALLSISPVVLDSFGREYGVVDVGETGEVVEEDGLATSDEVPDGLVEENDPGGGTCDS